jgi:hypothetical protein
MMKALFRSTAVATGLALSSPAAAQSAPSSCPPGSWFCAEPPQEQASPAGSAVQPLAPLPSPDEAAPPPSPPPYPPPPPPYPYRSRSPYASAPPPPPAVAYQPPPPAAVVRPEVPPPYAYPYPPPYYPYPPPRPIREWGLNVHAAAAAIGHGTAGNTSMGGLGAGLRFKPTPRFGIEADIDVFGGTDYQGDSRSETALSLNGLLFLNPRSSAQVYLLAGFGGSSAHVTCDAGSTACPTGSPDTHYGYFGGQVGVGLELRFGRVVALNADLRGFIRARTDSQAQSQPEFVDAYGRTTNSSAGALLTGGMTFYF